MGTAAACTGPLRRSGGGHVRLLDCFGLIRSQRGEKKVEAGEEKEGGGAATEKSLCEGARGAEGLCADTAAIPARAAAWRALCSPLVPCPLLLPRGALPLPAAFISAPARGSRCSPGWPAPPGQPQPEVAAPLPGARSPPARARFNPCLLERGFQAVRISFFFFPPFPLFISFKFLNFSFGRLHGSSGGAGVVWEIGRKEAMSDSLGLQLPLAPY